MPWAPASCGSGKSSGRRSASPRWRASAHGRRAGSSPSPPTTCAPSSSATATGSSTPTRSARLKHKTQVFVAPIGDHFVTRLTHTLEVTQIARTLARALRLNEDLVEAASLGHDVGHTPFGHIGEQVLDTLHPGGFRHNEQSLRTIDVLEKDGAGLNLTYETRMAVLHHSKPRGDFLNGAELDALSLEAQIVRVADAVAYLAHDIGDAVPRGRARRDRPPDGRPRAARLPPLAADRHDGPRHRRGLVGLRGLRRP